MIVLEEKIPNELLMNIITRTYFYELTFNVQNSILFLYNNDAYRKDSFKVRLNKKGTKNLNFNKLLLGFSTYCTKMYPLYNILVNIENDEHIKVKVIKI